MPEEKRRLLSRKPICLEASIATNLCWAAIKVHITDNPLVLLKELMGVVVDGGTVLVPLS